MSVLVPVMVPVMVRVRGSTHTRGVNELEDVAQGVGLEGLRGHEEARHALAPVPPPNPLPGSQGVRVSGCEGVRVQHPTHGRHLVRV